MLRACPIALSLLAGLLAGSACSQDEGGKAIDLSVGGQAKQAIAVSESAPERVRVAAETLAEYLGRISGGKFNVTTGNGTNGIAVGRPADFPALAHGKLWDESDPTRQEDYLLRSHDRGLYVIGASEIAVEHAVWDLLYRLGHRQFFPGEAWEVVPQSANLSLAVDTHEHPDYYARRIWYGYGPWDYAAAPYAHWCARNRATSGIELRSGHAYDGVIARNKAVFAAHPEYLGLVGGERKSTKLCISNRDLRQLVVTDALAQFQKDPRMHSLSVDPSDGAGWCECEQCRALGSISDRAVTLANVVAEKVQEEYGPKFIGMYAYNQHSPPPILRVHPQVVISVATAFIRGGYTTDELLAGWHEKGATLGIREYYSVNTWDRDQPGAARGSNTEYLKTSIPHFHRQGARFLSAESSDNWGPNGLGYYLAARMLWDIDEAERIDELTEDFLAKSFGTAREPMAEFYRRIDGANQPLPSDDLIGRLYRLLADGWRRTDDMAVHRRLDDLVLYTRFVELWLDYSAATGEERQAAFERMIRHVYRMRTTMMVHSKALYRDVVSRDRSVAVPEEARWDRPEGQNPWKSSEHFAREELDRFVSEGIAGRPLIGFEPVAFGTDLIPAEPLRLEDVPLGSMGGYSRGVRNYLTWVSPEQESAVISLVLKGGLIYQDRGDVQVALYPAAETEGKAVAQLAVPSDREEHQIALTGAMGGLNRIEVSDGAAGTSLAWEEGTPMTIRSSPDDPAALYGRWNLYFYVPKGTRIVGGYATGPGTLLDASGKTVHTFASRPGYFQVKVLEGQDGRLWKFHHTAGQRLLMTVPPYLARSPLELLLPAEVVKRDSKPAP